MIVYKLVFALTKWCDLIKTYFVPKMWQRLHFSLVYFVLYLQSVCHRYVLRRIIHYAGGFRQRIKQLGKSFFRLDLAVVAWHDTTACFESVWKLHCPLEWILIAKGNHSFLFGTFYLFSLCPTFTQHTVGLLPTRHFIKYCILFIKTYCNISVQGFKSKQVQLTSCCGMNTNNLTSLNSKLGMFCFWWYVHVLFVIAAVMRETSMQWRQTRYYTENDDKWSILTP